MISNELVATVIASTNIGGAARDAEQANRIADTLLRALHRAGYVIVPKKPTLEMLRDARRFGDSEGFGRIGEQDAECVWEDMIKAWEAGDITDAN